MSTSRIGDWIFTQSGTRFYPFDPRPEEVKLSDMARALSLKTRWSGHCRVFYAIATHSLRVMLLVEHLARRALMSGGEKAIARAGLYGLLHDGHEAYLTDVPSPLKDFVHVCGARPGRQATIEDLSPWTDHEERLDVAIFGAIGLPPLHGEGVDEQVKLLVKEADRTLLVIEARELLPAICLEQVDWANAKIDDDTLAVVSEVPPWSDHAATAQRFMLEAADRINLFSKLRVPL